MRVQSCLFILAAGFGAIGSAHPQAPRQPEVVCDLTPILAGAFDGPRLSRHDLVRENAEAIRLTFRDINPVAGTASMIVGQGASGEFAVAVTVDAGAIVYLHERPGVSKMIVSTAKGDGRGMARVDVATWLVGRRADDPGRERTVPHAGEVRRLADRLRSIRRRLRGPSACRRSWRG